MKDIPVLIDAIAPRDRTVAHLLALRGVAHGLSGVASAAEDLVQDAMAMGLSVDQAGDTCCGAALACKPSLDAGQQPGRPEASVAAAMFVAPCHF